MAVAVGALAVHLWRSPYLATVYVAQDVRALDATEPLARLGSFELLATPLEVLGTTRAELARDAVVFPVRSRDRNDWDNLSGFFEDFALHFAGAPSLDEARELMRDALGAPEDTALGRAFADLLPLGEETSLGETRSHAVAGEPYAERTGVQRVQCLAVESNRNRQRLSGAANRSAIKEALRAASRNSARHVAMPLLGFAQERSDVEQVYADQLMASLEHGTEPGALRRVTVGAWARHETRRELLRSSLLAAWERTLNSYVFPAPALAHLKLRSGLLLAIFGALRLTRGRAWSVRTGAALLLLCAGSAEIVFKVLPLMLTPLPLWLAGVLAPPLLALAGWFLPDLARFDPRQEIRVPS